MMNQTAASGKDASVNCLAFENQLNTTGFKTNIN